MGSPTKLEGLITPLAIIPAFKKGCEQLLNFRSKNENLHTLPKEKFVPENCHHERPTFHVTVLGTNHTNQFMDPDLKTGLNHSIEVIQTQNSGPLSRIIAPQSSKDFTEFDDGRTVIGLKTNIHI